MRTAAEVFIDLHKVTGRKPGEARSIEEAMRKQRAMEEAAEKAKYDEVAIKMGLFVTPFTST
jgi:hypothetical protein